MTKLTITEARKRIAALEAEVERLSKLDATTAYEDGARDALEQLAQETNAPKSVRSRDGVVDSDYLADWITECRIDARTVGAFLRKLGAKGHPVTTTQVLEALEELEWRAQVAA